MPIVSKNAQSALVAKLMAHGMTEAQISEALSLLAPKPRTPGQTPLKGLASAANAITDKLLCDAGGSVAADTMSRSAIRLSNIHGTSDGIATVQVRLEEGIAKGEIAKTLTTKKGNVVPSSASKALMRLKGICALTDD